MNYSLNKNLLLIISFLFLISFAIFGISVTNVNSKMAVKFFNFKIIVKFDFFANLK